MERPSRPEHDRSGQLESEPLPVVELEGGNHGNGQERDGQGGGSDQTSPEITDVMVLRCTLDVTVTAVEGGRPGQPSLVPGRLHSADEVTRADPRRVELDGGLLGCVVHGGLDAVELVELALDAVGA